MAEATLRVFRGGRESGKLRCSVSCVCDEWDVGASGLGNHVMERGYCLVRARKCRRES